MNKLCLIVFALMVIGCLPIAEDTFNSEELISSKGERIYVNTLNWGVTDDSQMSIITNNKNRLKKRLDTNGVVKGLEPFIYKFKNDTLSLYFSEEVNYKIESEFRTIHVNYIPLDRVALAEIRAQAYNNENGYHAVPKRKEPDYPSNIPTPTSNGE